MITTLVHVWVKEPHIDDFISATIENHKHSVQEPGNLRFDILRDSDNPTKFVLYEAYLSDEDAAAHKKTVHYLKWRDQVADWMAQPRQGMHHDIVYPVEASAW